jgi:hypothetical protein
MPNLKRYYSILFVDGMGQLIHLLDKVEKKPTAIGV